MTCDELAELLRVHCFNFASELELQDGIESVLAYAGLTVAEFKNERIGPGEYGREVKLECGRIDFLAEDIGIEIKVGGSLQAVTRQLHRYAGCERIGSLILVSSRLFHSYFPDTLGEKPLRVMNLINSAI